MKNTVKQKRNLTLIFDLVIVICTFFVKNIAQMMIKYIPDCFVVRQFGFLCPSCGGTRCVLNFFQGNFSTAFNYNPFIFILIIYLIIALLMLNLGFVFELEFEKKIYRFMTDYKTVIVIAVLFAFFGVARNLLPLDII